MADDINPSPATVVCDQCVDDAMQAEYDRLQSFLLSELGRHFRDPIVMAAVSAAVSLNGGLLGSLGVAERLGLDAAELKHARRISDSGRRRRNASGCRAIVWIAGGAG